MRSESIDRRAFLMLRTRGSKKVLELSCEQLYMQWVDAQSASTWSGEAGVEGSSWDGEPPTRVRTAKVTEILDLLERRLSSVDVLRVLNPEWLTDERFRHDVDDRIVQFRRRGGRVERNSTDSGDDS